MPDEKEIKTQETPKVKKEVKEEVKTEVEEPKKEEVKVEKVEEKKEELIEFQPKNENDDKMSVLERRLAALEAENTKMKTTQTLNSELSTLLEGTNINAKSLKNVIGFDSIQTKEDLKQRVEAYKETLKQNGTPYGAGKSSPKDNEEEYRKILAKKIKKNKKQ